MKLKVKGHLKVYVDGELVGDQDNLVVDTGLDAIIEAFGGDANKVVDSMSAGTGTTAPIAADVAMETPTFSKALTSITFPATGQVLLTFDIIPGEATGSAFTEFGLIAADGATLVARWVDGNTYNKTALNTIHGEWELTLSR
jgi:hypothetical protein